MKVYVCVDMEGIAGIVLPQQLRAGEPFYQEARKLLTEEVNAVVEGLLEAGAEQIVVRDIHGTGFNFLIDQLHPDALYYMGLSPMTDRFPGIDSTFDAAMLIGYHAMAGTERAVRDHTFSSRDIASMELNGRGIGEIGIDALLLGRCGVPVILVSGDDKTCLEAKQELGHVVTYQTKTAWERHGALMKSPKKVRAELKEAIREALENRSSFKPYTKQGPFEMKVVYMSTDIADRTYADGVHSERLDGRTIVYRADDFHTLFCRVFS